MLRDVFYPDLPAQEPRVAAEHFMGASVSQEEKFPLISI